MVEIDDVGVLVGVVLGLKLEAFFSVSIPILQEQSVGVGTVELIIKDLYFIEGWEIAISKCFGVGIIQRFGQ